MTTIDLIDSIRDDMEKRVEETKKNKSLKELINEISEKYDRENQNEIIETKIFLYKQNEIARIDQQWAEENDLYIY